MANEMQKMSEAVNVRKFRKIAKNIRRLVDHIRKEKSLSENLAREAFDQIDDLAIEALIAPPRNCDVGTAEEQWKRFDEFCKDWEESGPYGGCSDGCPCMAIKSKESDGCFGQSGCFSIWAQMPYDESEAIQ